MWRKKIHEVARKANSNEEEPDAQGHHGPADQEPRAMEVQQINWVSPVNSPRRSAAKTPPSSLSLAQSQADRSGSSSIVMLSSTPTIIIDVSKAGVIGGNLEDPESQTNGLAQQQQRQISSSSPGNAHFSSVNVSSPGPVHYFDPCTDPLHMDGHWHYSHRSPWLRALVLGANDGLVSISSLMLGVGAVKNDLKAMIISGLAGLVAGAGSMAIGEFVSVFSQRDTELADLEKERQEHAKGPEAQARELEELTQIYVGRGLNYYLAKQVAVELSKVDVLKAHARDELGIDIDALSNPFQAALASSLAFSLGGGVPLLAGAFIQNLEIRILVVVAATSFALAAFGAAGARLGGAPMWKAALRVLTGGWIAMALTYGILRLMGISGSR